MGQDKTGSKSGGFFHLFDWNKKSRKKLFSNGANAHQNSNQENKNHDNLSLLRLQMIDDDITGVSSVKGSSDYSCASSVTDEEGIGSRVPGVVARLMGLDSLPTSGVSEPHCTPLFDTRSLQNNHGEKRSPQLCINDQFSNIRHRAEVYSRKPMELKSQKPPCSPIERFQTEILPPRSAKSLPITHNKLLSPIKNPGFISAKNGAHIMEAAAKIIEPGLYVNSKGKAPLFGSSPIPLKLHDSKDSTIVSHRASRLLESSRRTTEPSDFRQFRGQPLNRSGNGPEDASISRPRMDSDETILASARGTRSWTSQEDVALSRSAACLDEGILPSSRSRGKSVSLAIQAKVNVQRREGLNTPSRNAIINDDRDDCKQALLFKSQSNSQRSKLQKKASTGNGSSVLRQNNQKQNCSSNKDKLPLKQSFSHQQGRKPLTGDMPSARNKTANKLNTNTRSTRGKEVLETLVLEQERLSSSNRDFPRKKRLIERSLCPEKSVFMDRMPDKCRKHVQPNIIIDEHSTQKEDNRRNGTDVVSFTFTSPMIKAVPGQSFPQIAEMWDKKNIYSFSATSEKINQNGNDKRPRSLGSSVISGDALSLLLEQKLRELTSGVEPSSSNFIKAGPRAASATILEASVSPFDDHCTSVFDHEHELLHNSCKDNSSFACDSGSSLSDGHLCQMRHKLQAVEGLECSSSSSDVCKVSDRQQPSPLSILEASFSNDSCNSSDSSDCTDGSKMSSTVKAQSSISLSSTKRTASIETEIELSDSASSLKETADGENTSVIGNASQDDVHKRELEYVKEILFSTGSMFKNLGSCFVAHVGEALDPLLYEKLENKRARNTAQGEDMENRMKRKLMFDCVNECLDLKCNHYFRSGYRSWARGVAVVGKELADELYEEISSWGCMGDWMVDELVDKDMSSHLGRWLAFEIEAFETGVEIEKEILDSLLDELSWECLTQ